MTAAVARTASLIRPPRLLPSRVLPARLLPLGLLALIASMVLAAVAGPAQATPAPTITTDRAQAASSWLAGRLVDASHQPAADGTHFEDSFGGSYYFSGLTLNAVWALAATRTGATKAGQILDYVDTQVASYANYDGSDGPVGLYSGGAAKLALSAEIAGRNPNAMAGHTLLDDLQSNVCTAQNNGDGFTTTSCGGAGAGTNVFSSIGQSLITLALVRGHRTPTAQQVSFLLSLQCPSGGFVSGDRPASPCTGDADSTAYAIMALKALGGHDSQVASAAAWLAGQRTAGGYWISQGQANTDSTGLATAALASLGQDVTVSRTWLLSRQVLTGPTFGPTASRGALRYGSTYSQSDAQRGTADGVLGLVGDGSLADLSLAGASNALPVLQAAGTVTASSVRAGAVQHVTGVGFNAGEPVLATLHSTPTTLPSTHADSTGTAALGFTVPAGLTPGTHSVTLTGTQSGLSATVAFTVTAAPAVASTGSTSAAGQTGSSAAAATAATLPATGLDSAASWRTAGTGVVLAIAGLGLLIAGRRRRA